MADVEQAGLTVLSEAAAEYCRVVFDLFPDEALVRVLLVSDEARWLNAWEEQSLHFVASGLAQSHPVDRPELGSAIQTAVEALATAPNVTASGGEGGARRGRKSSCKTA